MVALILRAALRQLPSSTGIRAKAQAAAQVLKNSAGVGTFDIELLNADNGVLLIAETILQDNHGCKNNVSTFKPSLSTVGENTLLPTFVKQAFSPARVNRMGRCGYKNKSKTATDRGHKAGGTQSNHAFGRTATATFSSVY